ncbi:unnamed protein product [Clavelina lepadiformis]|uniref:Uncharacterized protein n=1 Tax=Clavelina lepadiformis TaxID=159417 RepID=A0ABP0FSP2_CLALP
MHSCRGGVVKATDSKSVGSCPRRFESRRQRRYYFCNFIWIFGNVAFYLFHLCIRHSCRGRVVKATDSKSVEPSPLVVAEWLRRQTRNLLGLARVGSNPADNADITFAISYGYSEMYDFNYFIYALGTVVVAEWLRRQTRNLLGPARGVSGGYSYYSGKIGERRSTSCRFKPASRRVTSQQPFDDHRLTSRPPAG